MDFPVVMRRMDMGRDDALQMVQSRRAMIDPNPAFLEQLDVWERCRFDLQNALLVDREPGTDPVGLSCTTEGKERMAEGEEAKEDAERNRGEKEEDAEGKKAYGEEKGAEESREQRGGKENEKEKAGEGKKGKEKEETHEEDGGKEGERTKASPTAQTWTEEPDRPTNMVTGLKRACGMLAKSQEPQKIDDDRSAAAGPCNRIDTAPAGSPPPPSPTSDVVRAAIKSLYPKFPAAGKKKLLRLLNAGQGWRIASKDFRSYFVTGWGPKETATGTETETASGKDIPRT